MINEQLKHVFVRSLLRSTTRLSGIKLKNDLNFVNEPLFYETEVVFILSISGLVGLRLRRQLCAQDRPGVQEAAAAADSIRYINKKWQPWFMF